MTESNQQSVALSGRVKQELVPQVIRLVLAVVVLLLLRFLFIRVPGADSVIFDPDITVATILYSVLTLVMFGAIINYAWSLGAALSDIFDSFSEIERVIQLLGVLVVLGWAYQVFWWLPYFRENQAQYDYLFLIPLIAVLGWIGFILYTNVDELSMLLLGRVSDEFDEEVLEERDDTGFDVSSAVDRASSLLTVQDAGNQGEEDAPGEHGESVNQPTDTAASADTTASAAPSAMVTCPECNGEIPAEANFCNSCGAEVGGDNT